MKIAVIGTGRIGERVGRIWAHCGHSVIFGSRDPESQRARDLAAAAGENATLREPAAAAAAAELVFLAVPWSGLQACVKGLGDLSGKIVVDCANPLAPSFDALDRGEYPSSAEAVARWAPGARVVKAFNLVSASTLDDPHYGPVRADNFICGDDFDAKNKVARLVLEACFELVDAGPLQNARYLVEMAMLWILIAQLQGRGADLAVKLLKR